MNPAGTTLPSALVDVVLPAYNGAAVIRGALDSALAQDVPLRIIVVDDGSTDDSAAIARSYGTAVHVVVQKNKGVSGARNAALAAATAPYVAFLDQDDVWRPGKLRRQVDLIERHPQVGMVFTDMTILRPDGTIVEDGFLAATKEYAEIARTPLGDGAYLLGPQLGQAISRCNFISPSTALVRRDALLAIGGFDEHLRLCDDADCWMRLLHRCGAIAIERPLVLSLMYSENASLVKWRGMLEERLAIGAKALAHPADFPPGAGDYFALERPLTQYRLGLGELRAGNVAVARSWFLASLRTRWTGTATLACLATLLPAPLRASLLRAKRKAGLRMSVPVD
jgi:glycosyltransferase involved in cell wall biosynthesis